MPLFRYDGFDGAGGRVNGTLDAVSVEAALGELRARGVLPSSLALSENSAD